MSEKRPDCLGFLPRTDLPNAWQAIQRAVSVRTYWLASQVMPNALLNANLGHRHITHPPVGGEHLFPVRGARIRHLNPPGS